MLQKLRVTRFSHPLFRRLLASYCLVVLLLVSFTFFTFTFFREQIREEIIRYNTLNLRSTVDGYEDHVNLVYRTMLSYYTSDLVPLLDKPDFSYAIARQLRDDLQSTAGNELLWLENIAIYFESTGLVLEKFTSTDGEAFFQRFYSSSAYPLEFWEAQFRSSGTRYHWFPATRFYDATLRNAPVDKGVLFPFLVRNPLAPNVHMVAFLQANAMFDAMHTSIDDRFLILDASGAVVFASFEADELRLPEMPGDRGSKQVLDNYFFYMKGGTTGYTYVNIVPDTGVREAISRLNYTLIMFAFIALAISLTTSFLFSSWINAPIQKIVESLQHIHARDAAKRRTSEFELIDEAIHFMQAERRSKQEEIAEKTSLLESYAYLSKLKNIRHNSQAMKGLLEAERPFTLVLFRLTFRPTVREKFGVDLDDAQISSYFREYIRQELLVRFEKSHTFQVENDQIFSVVFDLTDPAPLLAALRDIGAVFDRDKETIFVTIAVSPTYRRSEDFSTAYEQVLTLAERRRFTDATQLLFGAPPAADGEGAVGLTPTQVQEFEANLSAGNADAVLALLRRIMAAMQKKEASAAQFLAFAEDIVVRTGRTLASLHIPPLGAEGVQGVKKHLADVHNARQLDAFFERMLADACYNVAKKRTDRDPVTAFVKEYLEAHYMEEITLDRMAEKLDITGGYLSTYFKEKTGMNFVDYVNDVRVRKARELLDRSPGLKIQDVAARVGYQNLNSFNRMFKKFTGLTPSEYRKEGGARGGAEE